MTVGRQNFALAGLVTLASSEISRADIRSMLDETQMLRDFDWPQIETLSAYVSLYSAPPGTVLFRECDQGDFMCIVLRGTLDICKEDTLHANKTVATVQAGRSLGEMAMVDSEPRSATARVVEPAILAVLTQEDFAVILRDKPVLAAKLLLKIAQLISQRLRQTSGVLVDFLEK